MNIEDSQKFLFEKYYCYIKDFANHGFQSLEEEFKKYWEKLFLDEKFKNYTRRKRRILRYFYKPGSPLKINKETVIDSKLKHKIKYTDGPSELTYVEDSFITHPITQHIINSDLKILTKQLDSSKEYYVDIHLFRVEATNGKISPTTSGIHQDGADWACIHFINADNVLPVVSAIHSTEEENITPLFKTVLNTFLETIIVNDKKIFHSASEVKQNDVNKIAFRDLLLVILKPTN